MVRCRINTWNRAFAVLMLLFFFMSAFSQNYVDDDVKERKMLMMARQYRYGIVFDVNTKKAASIYMHLARFGNTEAMTELGSMYLNGDGVEKNGRYAVNLFKKAAEDGNVKAKCNLALVYLKGLSGVVTHYKRAYELYKEAAEQGSANGMYGVGYMLYRGIGVKQNYDEALKYLKCGADKKHAGCCFLLATHYANGFNEIPDFSKAEKYLDLASEYGSDQTVDVAKTGYLDSLKTAAKSPRKVMKVNSNVAYVLNDTERESAYLENVLGRWRGKMYTYEWSATKILRTDDVECSFETEGDSVAVYIYQGDSLLTIYTPIRRKNFYVENRQKPYQHGFGWLVTKSHFIQDGDKLYASMKSLSTKTRTQRKPIVLELERTDDVQSVDNSTITSIGSVYYEDKKLYVDFDAQRRGLVKIWIYATDGSLVKAPRSFVADIGENSKELSIDLSQGIYVVELSASEYKMTKKIVVK